MTNFSERFGIQRPRDTLQIDDMDEALRNSLWNVVCNHFFQNRYRNSVNRLPPDSVAIGPLASLIEAIWMDLWKRPLDTREPYWSGQYKQVRDYVMTTTWNRVYDFIEFVPNHWPSTYGAEAAAYIVSCNRVLERELSAYRFVGRLLVRITDEEEIDAIEEATRLPASVRLVSQHLDAALRLLADRQRPDYRNSIKESISAVESYCALFVGQDKANLGAALSKLEAGAALHPALKKAFSALYGYTSDANGIRHALLDEADLNFDDAKFMLVACSAFINYLKGTASRL